MKKSIFLLTILNLFTLALQAQENQAAVSDSIIFDKLVYDMELSHKEPMAILNFSLPIKEKQH